MYLYMFVGVSRTGNPAENVKRQRVQRELRHLNECLETTSVTCDRCRGKGFSRCYCHILAGIPTPLKDLIRVATMDIQNPVYSDDGHEICLLEFKDQYIFKQKYEGVTE